MARFFFAKDNNFKETFNDFISLRRGTSTDVASKVSDIIRSIKEKGDNALKEYTFEFDGFDLEKNGFSFSKKEIENCNNLVKESDKDAIEIAIRRIRTFHENQKPKNVSWTDEIGATLGWIWKPIDKVGVYVPGGTASYPSSVIMNVVPALSAGVKDLVLCSPTPRGNYNPMVLYAASKLGVRKIFRIGGAQAIAALALGTETISKVNKVTGPGNSYVTEAKRQLVGEIGIDALAGPSEVVIICDKSLSPKLAAIDLLSQAEHDIKAQSILITDDYEYAKSVDQEIILFLNKLKRKEIAEKSWKDYGAIIIVPSLNKGIELSNEIAPEHLQVCFKGADRELHRINNAGSIFVGKWSPEAIGDYIGGSNHVLPTNGAAKYSSSLSVFDFLKRVSITELDKKCFDVLAPSTIALANSEGLEGHALSISERQKEDD